MPTQLATFYPAMADDTVAVEVTPSQALVLAEVCAGLANREIAERLYLSEDMVKKHLRVLMAKVGAANRAHLVALIYSGAITALVPTPADRSVFYSI